MRKKQASRAFGWLRDSGEMLARYPRPKDEHYTFERCHRAKQLQAKVRYAHNWIWTAQGSWKCGTCLRRKWRLEAPVDFQPCGHVAGSMLRMALNHGQHALSAALIDEGPNCIIFCRKCGAVAEYYAKKLAASTCRPATENCRRNLSKIEAGRHPSRDAFLADLWDITGEGTQHAAANQAWRGEDSSASSSSSKEVSAQPSVRAAAEPGRHLSTSGTEGVMGAASTGAYTGSSSRTAAAAEVRTEDPSRLADASRAEEFSKIAKTYGGPPGGEVTGRYPRAPVVARSPPGQTSPRAEVSTGELSSTDGGVVVALAPAQARAAVTSAGRLGLRRGQQDQPTEEEPPAGQLELAGGSEFAEGGRDVADNSNGAVGGFGCGGSGSGSSRGGSSVGQQVADCDFDFDAAVEQQAEFAEELQMLS